jgi:uncharacterized protein (DUF2267 family)
MEEEQFIHIVAEQLKVDHGSAEKIISAVFRELHDRLTSKEAADVEAQMPGKLRSLWASFEAPGRKVKRIHKTEFDRKVAELAGISEIESPRAVKAVFGALQATLKSPTGQEGEAWDIFSQLPKDLKRVWLEAAQSAQRGSDARR